MGATDPAKAGASTIRKVHAKSIGENSVHGSDAADTAAREIAQFFSEQRDRRLSWCEAVDASRFRRWSRCLAAL